MLESFSIGVLQPWGFALLAPILGALFYAYLRKRKLKPVVIPSLFLLQDLARPVSTRQRFVPPPRFWFELLMLSLLVICFSGMFRSGESKHFAILVDNSLSSAYRFDRMTILDLIKEQVTSAVGNLPRDSLFDLYRASPELERIGGEQLSPGALAGMLSQIQAEYDGDSLAEQLLLVNQRGDYAGVLLFTDRQINLTFDEKSAETKKNISVHTVTAPIERAKKNIAISRLNFEEDLAGELSGTLKAQAVNYAGRDQKIDLIIERLGTDEDSWSFYKKLSQDVPAGESREFSLPVDNRQTAAYRAHINVPGGELFNQLAEDDTAYFAFRRQNKVVYVVSARSLGDLGIEKIRGITFKQVAPEGFIKTLNAADAENYLFVDFMPAGLPDKNIIIVSPPYGSSGFDVGAVVPSAEVTEWITGHPLLTYIDVATLKFSKFVKLRPAVWSEPIIATTQGIAMIAGQLGRSRVVVTGFDLFPYRGRASPTVSVLFLNMLRWISAGSLDGQLVGPYERIPLPRGVATVEKIEDQYSPRKMTWQNSTPSFQGGSPGIYHVRFSGNEGYVVAINFYSDHESNPVDSGESISAPPIGATSEKLQTKHSFSNYLIPLVLLLLLVDFILRNREFVKRLA